MKWKTILTSFIFASGFFNSQIIITEVYYNTPANERPTFGNPSSGIVNAKKHHRGEFIEIYNYSDKDLNLRNWFIKDLASIFWLPDKVIKSGQFMVIAYSPLPYNTTDFPSYFGTTAGKESQIIYQNKLILRNLREQVAIGYAFSEKGGYAYWPSILNDCTWTHQQEPPRNFIHDIWSTPDKFYTINSLQLGSNFIEYFEGTPNPLEAIYKPPIQNYEAMVADNYAANYGYLDWADNIYEIIERTCPITIEKISQSPAGTSSNESICFSYDNAGNAITGVNCSGQQGNSGNGTSTGYTSDDLEEIKNSITITPNPAKASNNYNVGMEWYFGLAKDKVKSIQVFSSTGVLIYSYIPPAGVNSTAVNLQNQLPGVFIANFILDTNQVISKNILKW